MSDIPCQTPVDTKALGASQGGIAACSPLLSDYARKCATLPVDLRLPGPAGSRHFENGERHDDED
jgi:hypothetical protein